MSSGGNDWNDPLGAETYAQIVRTGELYRGLARSLTDLLAAVPYTRLVDLASGTGVVIEAASARGGRELVALGVDRSSAMLAVARREVPLPGVAFVLCDPSSLPIADAWAEVATCSAALWHFPALGRVFEETGRVLRRGGVLAMNVAVAQLDDLEGPDPAPVMLALAREGERRFGAAPEPAGPLTSVATLDGLARRAGLSRIEARINELRVTQGELVDLMRVRAFSERLYPATDAASRRAWVDEAARRIEPAERAPIAFWEAVYARR